MRRNSLLAAAAVALTLALAACQPTPPPRVLDPAEPPSTATIRVTVVHDGEPVPDASVLGIVAGQRGDQLATGTTDDDGRVDLEGPAGSWHVAASGLRQPHPTDPLCSTAADGSTDVVAAGNTTTEVTVVLAASGVYACA